MDEAVALARCDDRGNFLIQLFAAGSGGVVVTISCDEAETGFFFMFLQLLHRFDDGDTYSCCIHHQNQRRPSFYSIVAGHNAGDIVDIGGFSCGEQPPPP